MPHSDEDMPLQIAAALDRGDHETAGSLLRNSFEQAPSGNRLLRLAARQRKLAERFARVYALLKETREALQQDSFVRALGAFREAANLSQGLAALEQASFQLAVDEATDLEDKNWRIAGTLLEEASRIKAALTVPQELWEQVQAAERAEVIANVLAETALAKPADLLQARDRLIKALDRYPDDVGLANRLRSIVTTIEDKRKWDERQKRLKKLTELREALEREEDPARAGKHLAQGEALAGAHSGDAEFANVLEDIKQQVATSERALAALKQDRIDDCLEECAWVLSRMRHHKLFLNLKAQAEERELTLVDEEVARRKSEQSRPAGPDEENAKRLLERAESSLRQRHYRGAEALLNNALRLLPNDRSLAERIMAILHGCARTMVRENAEATAEVLALTARLFPGKPVPADLTEALRQKREQSRIAAVRWRALNKIGDLEGRLEAANTRDQLLALESEAANADFTGSHLTDVKEAAHALLDKIDCKKALLDRKYARQPLILGGISVAAALLLTVAVAYWFNRTQSAPVPLKSAEIQPSLPAKIEVSKTPQVASRAKRAPKLATLKINAAVAGTQIKLDGVLLGIAKKNKTLRRNLAAGDHSIELSRAGYLAKTIRRHLAPGEVLSLSARDLRLESSDARTYPNGPSAAAAFARLEELEWQTVDRKNPDSLRAYVTKYPASKFSAQARKDMESISPARAAVTSAPAAIDATARTAEKAYTSPYRAPAEAALIPPPASPTPKNDGNSEIAAVLTVLSRFASAWSTKDLDSILAIQRTLNKRAVKAELAQLKELQVRISPASPPQIEGSQAVVLCRREASQVFSDGTRKQIPVSIVSYVLEKRDGNWTIEGTR